MSRPNLSSFAQFSLKMRKKKELMKKQFCSMIDDMFETTFHEFNEYVRMSSTSDSPSEPSVASSKRIFENKIVEPELPDNSSATRKPRKANISSANLNLNSTKQVSTNKRKSISKVMTCKTVKRNKIEKKSKVYENALKRACTTSSSSDSAQEATSCSSTKSKEPGIKSQKKQCNKTVAIPTNKGFCQVSFQITETGITESLFNTEIEINKAMLGVFFDGNSQYFLCDVRQQSNAYKVYNIQDGRLHIKKPFSCFADLQHHFIKPIKFDSSIAVNTRVLVAWDKLDSELTPATIKDVFYEHKKVEVQNNKGKCAVVSIHDVFILPNKMPIMSDVSNASTSPAKSPQEKIYREKPIVDEFYNKYAKKNQIYADEKSYLEGLWRWADLIESGSLIEPDDNKLVNANSYRSVYKNNRIKFSLDDDVVIWDSADKAAYRYPIIGIIKRLYENIATKQKRVQFSWYLHPAEYPDSGLKPLKHGLIESSETSVVDVDYLLSDGNIKVMPFNMFQESFLNHNFVVEDIETYRLSLLKNPFQTYFKTGIYCHIRKIYKLDPSLPKEEFFLTS